ncbi:MAG: zinc ribbon domain-containing protein [Eubacterium sp.]|nr:zinc ribbon domain-containing protein [Eubacterium sp.]
MSTAESLGYVKGLIDGLELDDSKKETKVIKALVNALESIAEDIEDIRDDIEMVSDDLSDLEDVVYDDDDMEFDGFDEEFEIECPNCGEIISVDEETVMEGGIDCPNCGEKLEFEIEFEDEFIEDEE